MAYRILSAAVVACLAGLSAAHASDISHVRPECLDDSINQMNPEQLRECQKEIEAIFSRSPFFKSLAEKKCIDAYAPGRQVPGCIYVMRGDEVTAVVAPRRAK